MKNGYVKVAAGSVPIAVANPEHNKKEIIACMRLAHEQGVNLLVLPELCVTGYSCGDLFFSQALLNAARLAAEEIVRETEDLYPVVVFGLPLRHAGKLYNCAAVAAGGKLLGVVPKTLLPGYGEFCEPRHFTPATALEGKACMVELAGCSAPFGEGLVFRHRDLDDYAFGVELCEDLWAAVQPAQKLCLAGATIVVNTCASDELVGKAEERRMLVTSASSRLMCAYVLANASPTESTQDVIFSAHHLIAENGTLLCEARPFEQPPLLVCEVDTAHLAHERRRNNTFVPVQPSATIVFDQEERTHELTRKVSRSPFLAPTEQRQKERAEAILQIQSRALARRLAHTKAKTAVIGVSGGLDSTLALLVAVRAMKLLERPTSDVLAITMPCFGTTARTKSNAVLLCERLGVTLREVDITAAVRQHFADIGQDPECYDVTFENAQARERTQVLMDVANQNGGMVIGTGDLSELALGWATYNGDHMSMYGVNADVPKTLVRHLVQYEAERAEGMLARVLWDIVDTPVSPELLPADEQGNISQKTEDVVGPYELHDFFLYYMVRYGDAPDKIFRLARTAFAGEYDDAAIVRWLRVFCRRFFTQQFKRSCMPDGPKIGAVSLSPRGDWKMPSDADARLWLEQIDTIEQNLK